MSDRWVPVDNPEQQYWGIHEILYAVLGPELSQSLVETVEKSGEAGKSEVRQMAERLKELIGGPPSMLFLMGTAVAGLEVAIQNRYRDDTNPSNHDLVLRELGDETYKHFGSAYMHMFERFGFNSETLRYYMQNCAGLFKGHQWPPPGVAYRNISNH
jgi:hypothetical protein